MGSLEELKDQLMVMVPDLDPAVAGAFAEVDRGDFVPPGADAYAVDGATVLVREGDQTLSSVSAPWLVARMLMMADIGPGMKVLEIGAASGFNAALMTHLGAQVTSLEILPELAATARQRLDALGIPAIVLAGDGNRGHAAGGPYDRVMFTCSVHQLPPWVWDQTTPDARVVVPVRWGTGSCWALQRHADRFECDQAIPCGFVPMIDQPGFPTPTPLRGGLVWSGAQQPTVDTTTCEVQETWTSLVIGPVPTLGLWMRLFPDPRAGKVLGTSDGLPLLLSPGGGGPGLCDDGVVYVVCRPAPEGLELGVCSIGASAAATRHLLDEVTAYVHQPNSWPTITLTNDRATSATTTGA